MFVVKESARSHIQLLVLLITISVTTCKDRPTLGCSVGMQQVISYNNTLLSPTNVTATNEDVNFNPDDYLFHRNNVPLRLWCTEPLSNRTNFSIESETVTLLDFLSSSEDQGSSNYSISVNLTRPVLITQVGTSGFSNGFVNNFTLMYSTGGGNLTTYEQSTGKVFIVSKIDTVFTLEQPFMALRLNFQINNGVISPSGRLCWHLTLFGCPSEDVVTKQQSQPESTSSQSTTTPSTSITPTQTSSTPTHTPPFSVSQSPSLMSPSLFTVSPSPMSSLLLFVSQPLVSPSITVNPIMTNDPVVETPTPPSIIVVKDYQILIIAIPAAVVTILIVTCVVAIGVCICMRNHGENSGWRSQKNGFRSSQLLSNSTNTLRVVENGTLYKSSSPLLSLTTAEGRGLSEMRDDGLDVNKPVYENVARDTIPSNKESGYYEPVNPLSDDDSIRSSNSMVDNPTYSVPFPVGQPRPLLGQPRPPLPPIPTEELPWRQGDVRTVRQGVINMVDNECYQAPVHGEEMEISMSQSYSNRLPNDYETPL